MTRLTLIAAVARNGVIGSGGDIPWRLPGELARFKETTMGHVLIMGRATFDSIGRPLPGRRTVVITRNREWQHAGVEVAHSLTEALAVAGPVEEVFVAGGAQIYAEAMPFADRMIVTEVPLDPGGDTFFPPWNRARWVEVSRIDYPDFDIVTYDRSSAP